MDDAEFVEINISENQNIDLIYVRTLIDQERLNESIVKPLSNCSKQSIQECNVHSTINSISTFKEAKKQLFKGSVLLFDSSSNLWFAIPLKNPLGRAIEPSDTETILLGAKDSFSEQLEQNITLIRRRLPTHDLKTEKFTVGSLSETNVVLLYIEGLTNPEFVSTAKKKIRKLIMISSLILLK